MEWQENKAWLMRYLECQKEIWQGCAAVRRWQRMAEGGTPQYDFARGGQKSTHASRVEKAVCEMVRLQQTMAPKVERMLALRREIGTAVEALPQARLRLILQYRYFHGLTFAAIGQKMGYCEYYISVLHQKGLSLLHSENRHKIA